MAQTITRRAAIFLILQRRLGVRRRGQYRHGPAEQQSEHGFFFSFPGFARLLPGWSRKESSPVLNGTSMRILGDRGRR
jgi:hypothetical protein